MNIGVGDIANAFESLKKLLKKGDYKASITLKEINEENPSVFFQILHHFFIDHSKEVYKYFVEKDYELYSKNDLRFMETIYKIVIKEFQIKPSITLNQYLTNFFLEKKILLTTRIVETIFEKEKELAPKTDKASRKQKPKVLYEGLSKLKIKKSETERNLHNDKDNEGLEIKYSIVPTPLSLETAFPKMREEKTYGITENQGDALIAQNDDDLEGSDLYNKQFFTKEKICDIDKDSKLHSYEEKENQNPNVSSSSFGKEKPKGDKTNRERADDLNKQEVLQVMMQFNENFTTLAKQFEHFQLQVGNWMNNVNAQLILLENNQKMIKMQLNKQQMI